MAAQTGTAESLSVFEEWKWKCSSGQESAGKTGHPSN